MYMFQSVLDCMGSEMEMRLGMEMRNWMQMGLGLK